MYKLRHTLIIILILYGITTYAQKVSNINFHQEQSTIIVSYDLETKTTCKVSLYVSTNDGKTWQGPLTKVTGDVGDKIVSGRHNITWNVLEEFEEFKGDNIKFQIRALGNNNATVMIGNQEWSTKNLNVSKYRNGDIIPEVRNQKEWEGLRTGAWCYYNNDPKNGKIYGKLYNWYAVNDLRGLAPVGFHIPSDSEWNTLIDYLGGYKVAGGKMKKIGISNWSAPNLGATNESGFSGLPGGYRNTWEIIFLDRRSIPNLFNDIGNYGQWWSSSEQDFENSWTLSLNSSYGDIRKEKNLKEYGYSVRCIRD
jgi:uncharacterized protein (TIGR02145 family)